MVKHQTSPYKERKDAQKAQARKDMRAGKIRPGNSPSPAYRTPTKKK